MLEKGPPTNTDFCYAVFANTVDLNQLASSEVFAIQFPSDESWQIDILNRV